MQRTRFVAGFAIMQLIWLAGACSPCGVMRAEDYDQTCNADSDCVAVTAVDLCSDRCTNCINAAINVRDEVRYEEDFSSKMSSERICPCPPGGSPVCHAHVCVLGAPR